MKNANQSSKTSSMMAVTSRRDALRKIGMISATTGAAIGGSAVMAQINPNVNPNSNIAPAVSPTAIPTVGAAELGGLAVLAAAVAAYQIRKKG